MNENEKFINEFKSLLNLKDEIDKKNEIIKNLSNEKNDLDEKYKNIVKKNNENELKIIN